MTSANLLNHLWQSTLFAAVTGLLTLALRNNRAPVRYGLWFTASVKFLIPFALLVTLGSQVEWRKAPAAAPIPIAGVPLPSVMEQIGQPFPTLPANRPHAPIDFTAVLLGAYLCGFSVVVIGWIRQWRRLRTALRAASPLPLHLPIRAMSSPARLEPGVFGVFRPVLLLPEGIIDRLTPAQWNAVLAHELCHVRRRDNLTAAIHMAVEAIFWFHPLVWWIGKRLLAERERACDEEVLLAANDPQDYAEGILNVCKLYAESPLTCVSGVTGSNLKRRIRAIMTEPIAGDLHFGKKLALAFAGIAAVIVPLVIGLVNAPVIHAQSPQVQSPQPQSPLPQSPPPAVDKAVVAEPDAPAPQPAPPANPAARVIGLNDLLYIDVFREPDFRGAYTVKADGTVTIPLIGGIKAVGLTTRQLQRQLTEVLSQYARDRDVIVTVAASQQTYSVTGMVERPGAYPLVPPFTVFNALRLAGGFTADTSDPTDISILRGGERLELNYEDYAKGGNRDKNIALQNGDVILVK